MHDGIGPADLAGSVDGDDGFLHGVEQRGQLALLGFEGLEGSLQAVGGGIEGARHLADFVVGVLLDARGEVAAGDAAGEVDDAAQAGGDAMRQPCGGEGGQNQRDQRCAEEIAAQNVQRGGALFCTEGGDAGFLVERVVDDVTEGKVQDCRGDAQHEDERQEQLGKDSAGHVEIQRTGFSVQGSAENRSAKSRPARSRFGVFDSALIVGGGPEHAGNRDIEQTQEDAELGAVMNDVIHENAAERHDAGK